jgi:hypothetical protein
MHLDLSEALAKMRIDDLHREAALYRLTHSRARPDGRERSDGSPFRGKRLMRHRMADDPGVQC